MALLDLVEVIYWLGRRGESRKVEWSTSAEATSVGQWQTLKRIIRLIAALNDFVASAGCVLSMANFKSPLVANKSPHPSRVLYFFFDEN